MQACLRTPTPLHPKHHPVSAQSTPTSELNYAEQADSKELGVEELALLGVYK